MYWNDDDKIIIASYIYIHKYNCLLFILAPNKKQCIKKFKTYQLNCQVKRIGQYSNAFGDRRRL